MNESWTGMKPKEKIKAEQWKKIRQWIKGEHAMKVKQGIKLNGER